MKNRLMKLLAILCYFAVMGLLLDFKWNLIIKSKPFLLVILGTVLLSVSQYSRKSSRDDIITGMKWNMLFAGFLTTLMSILSFISVPDMKELELADFSSQFLPLLYGALLYLVTNLIYSTNAKSADDIKDYVEIDSRTMLMSPVVSEKVFKDFELTARECHIAAKLLEDITNKEIASQLYISEATVKKHIQNIYQKLQLSDRSSFRKYYMEKARQILSQKQ
ncbi:MAG: LuxR C-terminal-related transcriptional regulator [Bacillota bacterium]